MDSSDVDPMRGRRRESNSSTITRGASPVRPHRLRRSPEREWKGVGFGFNGEPVKLRDPVSRPWVPNDITPKHDSHTPMCGGTFPVSTNVGTPYQEILSGPPYPWERAVRALDLRDVLSKSPV